jgi:hypothetical protein
MRRVLLLLFLIYNLNNCFGQVINLTKKSLIFSKNETIYESNNSHLITDPFFKLVDYSDGSIKRLTKLDFDCSVLPGNAIIDSIMLQFSFQETSDKQFNLFVGCISNKALETKKDNFQNNIPQLLKDFESSTTTQKEYFISSAIPITEKQKNYKAIFTQKKFSTLVPNKNFFSNNLQKSISLMLFARSEATATVYSSKSQDYNLKPQLIISYHLEKEHFNANEWTQTFVNPQHNSTVTELWKNYSIPKTFNEINLLSGGSDFKFTQQPLFADNLLIVPVEYSKDVADRFVGKVYLHAYAADNSAKLIASSDSLSGSLAFPPIINPKSEIVCIVGNEQLQRVKIFKLNGNKIFCISTLNLYEITGANNATVRVMPTMGSDGSLYLSTLNGLIALTPDYQLKWNFKKSNNSQHFGIPSLSVDESKLYVVNADERELETIDNITGSEIKKDSTEINKDSKKYFKLINFKTEVSHFIDLPTPVVNVENGSVIVLSDVLNINSKVKRNEPFLGNKLLVYNSNGVFSDSTKCYGPDSCFGQPIAIGNSTFTVQGNKLERYDLIKVQDSIKIISYLNSSKSNEASDYTKSIWKTKYRNSNFNGPIQKPDFDTLYNQQTSLLAYDTTIYAFTINSTDRKISVYSKEGSLIAKHKISDNLFAAVKGEGSEKNLLSNHFSIVWANNLYTTNSNNIIWFNPSTYIEGNDKNVVKKFKEDFHVANNDKINPINIKKGNQFRLGNGLFTDFIVDTAGNIGFGTVKPLAGIDCSNLLKGIILPSADSSYIADLKDPQEGLIFYNNEQKKVVFYNGKRWVCSDGTYMNKQFGDIIEDEIFITYQKAKRFKSIVEQQIYERTFRYKNGYLYLQKEVKETFNSFIVKHKNEIKSINQQPSNENTKQLINQSHNDSIAFSIDLTGKVGFNTSKPSNMMDLRNIKSGIILPSTTITATQKVETEGAILYDTINKGLVYSNGNTWVGNASFISQTKKDNKNVSNAKIKIASIELNNEQLNLKALAKEGFKPPILSEEEIKKIYNPKIGTLVYNTTEKFIMIFNGTEWLYTDDLKFGERKLKVFNVTYLSSETKISAIKGVKPVEGMLAYDDDILLRPRDTFAVKIFKKGKCIKQDNKNNVCLNYENDKWEYLDKIPDTARAVFFNSNTELQKAMTAAEIYEYKNPITGMVITCKDLGMSLRFEGGKWKTLGSNKLLRKLNEEIDNGLFKIFYFDKGKNYGVDGLAYRIAGWPASYDFSVAFVDNVDEKNIKDTKKDGLANSKIIFEDRNDHSKLWVEEHYKTNHWWKSYGLTSTIKQHAEFKSTSLFEKKLATHDNNGKIFSLFNFLNFNDKRPDWFIPSKEELSLLFTSNADVNKSLLKELTTKMESDYERTKGVIKLNEEIYLLSSTRKVNYKEYGKVIFKKNIFDRNLDKVGERDFSIILGGCNVATYSVKKVDVNGTATDIDFDMAEEDKWDKLKNHSLVIFMRRF